MTIDAVITWVDGSDPQHVEKKDKWLSSSTDTEGKELPSSGRKERRWENNGEILLCLESIKNHAPWIRTIWIVTDSQAPDLDSVDPIIREKVKVVDHKVLYAGFEQYLPTFNSQSIETVLWRIPGLADRFIYFNDDFFLTGRLEPEDLFEGKKPIVRGNWLDLTGEELSMYRAHQVNGAKLAGYAIERFFAPAHVANIINKNILETFFEKNPQQLEENLSHRFREYSQFSSYTLMTHLGIDQDEVILRTRKEWQNISVKICKSRDPELIEAKLNKLLSKNTKFGCINDLPKAAKTYPQTLEIIKRAIGAS
ncbi:Stealth CR1 domain-containing protein [Salinicola halophyticus]|uniref:Stealth CR1 domain-containing protein n=1 Tax=Salinicola halophyticus TaxID=1808881 RepID=UPI003F48C1B1